VRTLTKSEQESLDALASALSHADHGLGSISNPECAPSRVEEVRVLLAKGETNWTPEDLDWLFFKAATTVGSEETVKFVLLRLLGCLLRDELLGAVSVHAIPGKLEYAKFQEWPSAERTATIDTLSKLAQHWTDDDYFGPAGEDIRAFIARNRPN
jgi:hypothetical protein